MTDPTLESLMLGPRPPAAFEDNGCGPKTPSGWLAWLIPEKRYGVTFSLACRYHDYHWYLAEAGSMPGDWVQADMLLRQNIYTHFWFHEVRHRSGLDRWKWSWRGKRVAWVYWRAVRTASRLKGHN